MKSKILIQCSFLLINTLVQAQVLWPVYPQNQPHTISGTYGEYRVYSRFHQGVDILNGNNHNVYAIESGKIDAFLNLGTIVSQINVQGLSGIVKYVHVDPGDIWDVGDSVHKGDLIGKMSVQSSIHVHLESSLYPNLLAHRLPGYTDNIAPGIQSVSFRQNGITLTNNTPAFTALSPYGTGQGVALYNKVDIMARVSDMIGGYTCAPSRLLYEVFNQNNVSVDNGSVCNLNFEQPCLNAAGSYCFGYGSSFSPPVYNYVLTANSRYQPYNRYWNTGLRQDVTENWSGSINLDARFNDECRYPDGQYNVVLLARDVDYDNTFNQTVSNNPVVIDNFRPIVSRVEIRKESGNGQLIYLGQWVWNAGVLNFTNPTNISGYNPSKIWIKITTSESMSDVWLKTGSFEGILINPETGSLGRDWVFTLPVSYFANGSNQLIISGHDLANNELEGFVNTNSLSSSSIPIHRLDGSWSVAALHNSDIVHAFNIQLQTAPVANYIPLEVTVNPGDQVVFTDLSTGGPTQWDWSFDSGDPAFSSIENPVVTYEDPGDYVVVLHVFNQAGVSSITGIVHVTQSVIAPVAAFSPDELNITPGTMVNFADLSSGNPQSWFWDFGNGAPSSNLQNPDVVFDYEGDFPVSLLVANNAGTSSAWGIIHVSYGFQPIEVMCNVAPFMAVTGSLVYFSGTVLGGTPPYQFIIDPGDGSMQYLNGNTPNFGVSQVFNQNGDFSFTVVVVDANGNTGTCCEFVTIYGANPCASLYADFVTATGGMSIAENSPCTFIDQTTGGTEPYLYAWHFFPDPQTNAQPSITYSFSMVPPPVVFPEAGSYPVSLHVYDNLGCTHTIIKDVQVFKPQHCLVAMINIGNHQYHKIRKGNSCFWDFSYSLADFNCSDPPGSGNLPCETNAEWSLVGFPAGNYMGGKYTHPNDPVTCAPNSVNDQLFEHNFIQEGKYLLKLHAWDQSCNVQTGYTCDGQTSTLLDVVDCDKNVSVCNTIMIPGNYNGVDAGTIEIGGANCTVLYMSGSNIQYHAFNQIKLRGEVLIQEGAEFLANVEDCPPVMPCSKAADLVLYSVDEEPVSVYPVPASGVIFAKLNISEPSLKMDISDVYGRIVICDFIPGSTAVEINLESFTPGVYFARFHLSNGVVIRRIVLI
jgi:PKD repeat protein